MRHRLAASFHLRLLLVRQYLCWCLRYCILCILLGWQRTFRSCQHDLKFFFFCFRPPCRHRCGLFLTTNSWEMGCGRHTEEDTYFEIETVSIVINGNTSSHRTQSDRLAHSYFPFAFLPFSGALLEVVVRLSSIAKRKIEQTLKIDKFHGFSVFSLFSRVGLSVHFDFLANVAFVFHLVWVYWLQTQLNSAIFIYLYILPNEMRQQHHWVTFEAQGRDTTWLGNEWKENYILTLPEIMHAFRLNETRPILGNWNTLSNLPLLLHLTLKFSP